jgi:hypothetical protein
MAGDGGWVEHPRQAAAGAVAGAGGAGVRGGLTWTATSKRPIKCRRGYARVARMEFYRIMPLPSLVSLSRAVSTPCKAPTGSHPVVLRDHFPKNRCLPC